MALLLLFAWVCLHVVHTQDNIILLSFAHTVRTYWTLQDQPICALKKWTVCAHNKNPVHSMKTNLQRHYVIKAHRSNSKAELA